MEFETYIGFVLRAGVLLSLLFILIGFFMISKSTSSASAPGTSALLDFNTHGIGFGQMAAGLQDGSGIYYMLLGIIILFATPVARVLLSVIWFAVERNPLYTAITLVVLINLLLAIFLIPHLVGIY